MHNFTSTLILFFLVMDPLGNLPVFIAELGGVSSRRYWRIVLRESLVALAVLLVFLFFGGAILAAFRISRASMELAGGIILFMIAVKMVFGSGYGEADKKATARREPFIVPLAIPLFAGPATISTVILIGGNGGFFWEAAALIAAWMVCTAILLSGRYAGKIFGAKVLFAFEALMGLLLTMMALEMMISGIKQAFCLK